MIEGQPTNEPKADDDLDQFGSLGLVLLVDQSEDIRWTMREAFRMRGFATVLAESVWASKKALEDYSFEVILSGMVLRDGSGLELLPIANATTPETAMFLMSGHPQNVSELRKLGALAFFQKPFDALEVVDKIIAHSQRHVASKSSV